MAIAYVTNSVAYTNNADGNDTTVAVTLGAAVAIGDYIIGMAGWDPSGSATITVADSLGNTYTVESNLITANQRGQTFYARVTVAGTPVITVTFSVGSSFRRVIAAAWSGLASSGVSDGTVGNGQASPGTGTDAVTSTAITTTVNGDLIVGFYQNEGEGAPGTGTITAGTGFTRRNAANSILAIEDLVQSTAGSKAATFTLSITHSSISHISSFKVATSSLPNKNRIFGRQCIKRASYW